MGQKRGVGELSHERLKYRKKPKRVKIRDRARGPHLNIWHFESCRRPRMRGRRHEIVRSCRLFIIYGLCLSLWGGGPTHNWVWPPSPGVGCIPTVGYSPLPFAGGALLNDSAFSCKSVGRFG